MKSTIRLATKIAIVILIIDAFCFAGWVASDQKPEGNFYAGTITAHVLGAILK